MRHSRGLASLGPALLDGRAMVPLVESPRNGFGVELSQETKFAKLKC